MNDSPQMIVTLMWVWRSHSSADPEDGLTSVRKLDFYFYLFYENTLSKKSICNFHIIILGEEKRSLKYFIVMHQTILNMSKECQ